MKKTFFYGISGIVLFFSMNFLLLDSVQTMNSYSFSAPTDVQATDIHATLVKISFQPVPGTSQYVIFHAEGKEREVIRFTGSSVVVDSLAPNTEYSFVVHAAEFDSSRDSLLSPASAPVTFRTSPVQNRETDWVGAEVNLSYSLFSQPEVKKKTKFVYFFDNYDKNSYDFVDKVYRSFMGSLYLSKDQQTGRAVFYANNVGQGGLYQSLSEPVSYESLDSGKYNRFGVPLQSGKWYVAYDEDNKEYVKIFVNYIKYFRVAPPTLSLYSEGNPQVSFANYPEAGPTVSWIDEFYPLKKNIKYQIEVSCKSCEKAGKWTRPVRSTVKKTGEDWMYFTPTRLFPSEKIKDSERTLPANTVFRYRVRSVIDGEGSSPWTEYSYFTFYK